MKKSIFLLMLLALCISGTAQNWVTIPDANFANKLNLLFPQCMDGNLMNTECDEIVFETYLNVQQSGISDLSGIEHFVSLESLDCSNNNLTWLPDLPISLINLGCHWNNLTSLSSLPETINNISCYNNNLTTLPVLPQSLIELHCQNNNLLELPVLPESLNELVCYFNDISVLPELPESLTILNCSGNNISNLPELPENLIDLNCNNNNLTTLPTLPQSLNHLSFDNNNISETIELPSQLMSLYCYNNNITVLPELPATLTALGCSNNNLSSLPQLPPLLSALFCDNNSLTSLPELPSSLNGVRCHNNLISCLPTLPMSITNSSTNYLNLANNPFTCLPNYVPAMSGPNALWLNYPLCDLADVVNNPFGCSSFAGISGTVYSDENTNCEEEPIEFGVINAPLFLLNDIGDLVSMTYSFGDMNNTYYNFLADEGTYSVILLTENMPFQASCDDPGSTQNVALTIPSPSAQNVDFGVVCQPGFDVGVLSVISSGWVFPGQIHELNITAGDMTSWYGLNCAQDVSGTVTVVVNGPVSYVGPAAGGLTPTVSDDLQFTYDITDFSLVNFQEDFALLFETDTTALAGELICIDIIVNPIDDDLNPTNNSFNHCYQVVNSYDPNIKQVWPHNVEPGFDGYFNYTIYFQNTGTAPAFNIRLADTLDTNLDLSTFQVTNYSHPVLTYLHGNVLTFRFNNIMLPDSTSDLEGSIGYVQYRIKPIAGLLAGTVIENTAHIFFDFNDAIVTNTTQNEFVTFNSVANITMPELSVFPNPGSGLFSVSLKNGAQSNHQNTLEIYNLRGQRILQQQMNENQTVLDLSNQPSGIYMLRLQNTLGTKTMKLVKQ